MEVATWLNAADVHLVFSGSGWMEFNLEMKDLAIVDWGEGTIPGFDLTFEDSTATVYLDDITADWRPFGPR